MDYQYLLIPDITKETRAWTARVTVTEDIPIMFCKGDTKLKRYILTDSEGNDIVATVFDKDVPLFESVIKLFCVYEISNAQLKDIPSEYRVMDRPYQWRLQRTTLIRPDLKTPPTLRFLNRNLTPFSVVVNDLELGKQADILGVVIEASSQNVALTKDGVKDVQRFTFVDTEMQPLTITLWGPMVQSVGAQLELAAKRYSVVLARRLTVTYFKGVALSGKNCSSFTLEPPMDEAAEIKSWFDTVKERELANLLTDKTIAVCKARFDSGVMRLHTVKELEDSAVCGDYWMRGKLSIVEDEQKLFYIACSRCYTKINISEDKLHYFCWVCKNETVSTLRLIIQARVCDGTGVMKVSAIDATAEQLLDTNPTDFARVLRMRWTFDIEARRLAFGERMCTMLLRRTYGKRFDEKRRMLLIDFSEDVDATVATPLVVEPLSEYVPDGVGTDSVAVSLNNVLPRRVGKRSADALCSSAGEPEKRRRSVVDVKEDVPDSSAFDDKENHPILSSPKN